MHTMNPIKTGLASFGMSGRIFHAPFISCNPHFELTAIVERTKELSKALYPKATIIRSFDELICQKELELIVINTPDATHFEYARKALEAGKHVIVEKPFTTTVIEAEILVEMAKEKGLTLAVYQNRRWDSDFLTVCEIIQQGTLGRLVEFESTFPRYRNFIKPDTWKETGVQGGGLTYNLGSHLIDQAVQLFGAPKAVFADIATLRTDGKVDDYFIIHLLNPVMAPDVRVTLKSSYLMCEPEPRFVLHGTEGSFVKYGLDRQEEDLNKGLTPTGDAWGKEDDAIWGVLHTQKGEIASRTRYPSQTGNYAGFYQNIFEHIRKGKSLQTDAADVIPVIRIIEAAYKSSSRQEVVTL